MYANFMKINNIVFSICVCVCVCVCVWWTSLMAQTVKRLSTMWETRVRSLGWEDPLEKEMAIHSRTIYKGRKSDYFPEKHFGANFVS